MQQRHELLPMILSKQSAHHGSVQHKVDAERHLDVAHRGHNAAVMVVDKGDVLFMGRRVQGKRAVNEPLATSH